MIFSFLGPLFDFLILYLLLKIFIFGPGYHFLAQNAFVVFLFFFTIGIWLIIYCFKSEPFVTISIVKELDFLGFVFANFCLFLVFNHFLNPSENWVFFISFMISFLILCQDKFVKIFQKKRSVNHGNGYLRFEWPYLKKVFPFFFPVFIREFFFNTLYYLFPLILIWISISGLFFLTDLTQFTPTGKFFEVITVISIILGIFQFYVRRVEKKILKKITQFSQLINQIIEIETDFDHFYQFVKHDSDFKIWINETLHPKLYANDILVKILTEGKQRKLPFITDLIKNYKGPLVNITLSPTNSYQNYAEIEQKASREEFFKGEYYDKLCYYYKEFFGEISDDQTLKKIEEKIDLAEFGNLTLTNINIFQEASAEFINNEMKNVVSNMFNSQSQESDDLERLEALLESENDDDELISSIILRLKMKERISRKISDRIFLDS